MKLTRSQLRRLIFESVLTEMPMIKPGGSMSPDHYGKIKTMIDTGDEATIGQADELASMVGHESDHLSQDLATYDQQAIMGEFGDIQQYLTREDIQKLMNAKGRVLRFALHSWYGFGFWEGGGGKNTGGDVIAPQALIMMAGRLVAKNPDITDDEAEDMAGLDKFVDQLHALAQRIMSLSKHTEVSMYDMNDAGIGDPGEGMFGTYNDQPEFYQDGYEALYKAKKLVIVD